MVFRSSLLGNLRSEEELMSIVDEFSRNAPAIGRQLRLDALKFDARQVNEDENMSMEEKCDELQKLAMQRINMGFGETQSPRDMMANGIQRKSAIMEMEKNGIIK